MFRFVQIIIRESTLSLAKVTFCRFNQLWCVCVSTKSNFSQAQCRLPDDNLHGPKHVGVTVKNYFNVNFNVSYFIC